MKSILLSSFCLFLLSLNAFAQPPVPNGNFESWTAGEPDGWFTNYDFDPAAISQTTGVSGSAVMGTVVFFDEFLGGVTPSVSTNYEGLSSFPVDGDYPGVSFQYKFSPVNGDNMFVSVVTYDANDNETGTGFLYASEAASSFTQGYIPITYFTPGTSSMNITAVIVNFNTGFPNVGSSYVLDNFAISSSPLSVEESTTISGVTINKIYPNPASDFLSMDLETGLSGILDVELFDLSGKKAMSESFRITAGKNTLTLPVADQSSGMYLLQIRSGEHIHTERVRIAR